jgi:fermentation-respiration switch protein FrsA (DUF1100 family)
MRRLAYTIAASFIFAWFGQDAGAGDKPVDKGDLGARAKRFVDQMAKGQFQTATEEFDDTMKKVAPPDKLKETWESVIKSVGPFKKQKAVRADRLGKYDLRFVACEFKKADLDARVVFDAKGRIAGLQFVAPQPKDSPAPPYANRSRFRETEVTVGAGAWAVRGTLAVPAGAGPFPAVVLVHGSGPQDRDVTVGPNKPFRDLAWGLASKGVAVLRYEKRTKEHGPKMVELAGTLTLKEEVFDDALAAVALLRKTDGIAPGKIVVLGHSLGGMCAPKIGELDPAIAGLVLMAANARPLEDVLVEQVNYVMSLDRDMPEEARKMLDTARQKALAIKNRQVTPQTPSSEIPFGLSANYWISLRDYHQTETAARLKQPLLILQGERDYQVTMEDFHAWQKALGGRSNVTFKSYPQLNHLFLDGVGKAKPAEYEHPGHVATEVVDQIAAWVKAL